MNVFFFGWIPDWWMVDTCIFSSWRMFFHRASDVSNSIPYDLAQAELDVLLERAFANSSQAPLLIGYGVKYDMDMGWYGLEYVKMSGPQILCSLFLVFSPSIFLVSNFWPMPVLYESLFIGDNSKTRIRIFANQAVENWMGVGVFLIASLNKLSTCFDWTAYWRAFSLLCRQM